jgi:hypothetical protein
MNRSRSFAPLAVSAAVALALVIVLVVMASGVLGRSAASPAPSGPPASPTVPPTLSPVVPEPSDNWGREIRVELETATGRPSWVVVRDETESLAGARSGHPGEGVSVDYNEVMVESIDDDTIRITWADLLVENEASVLVSIGEDGVFHIRIVRPRPDEPVDSFANDRVLILDFNVAVPIEDVNAWVQPSIDTPS